MWDGKRRHVAACHWSVFDSGPLPDAGGPIRFPLNKGQNNFRINLFFLLNLRYVY